MSFRLANPPSGRNRALLQDTIGLLKTIALGEHVRGNIAYKASNKQRGANRLHNPSITINFACFRINFHAELLIKLKIDVEARTSGLPDLNFCDVVKFYFFVSVMSVSVSLPTVTVQYVIFLVIDAFRLLILAQLTGLARVKTKEFHAPEDARGKDYTPVGQDTSSMSLAARAMRAHYNA